MRNNKDYDRYFETLVKILLNNVCLYRNRKNNKEFAFVWHNSLGYNLGIKNSIMELFEIEKVSSISNEEKIKVIDLIINTTDEILKDVERNEPLQYSIHNSGDVRKIVLLIIFKYYRKNRPNVFKGVKFSSKSFVTINRRDIDINKIKKFFEIFKLKLERHKHDIFINEILYYLIENIYYIRANEKIMFIPFNYTIKNSYSKYFPDKSIFKKVKILSSKDKLRIVEILKNIIESCLKDIEESRKNNDKGVIYECDFSEKGIEPKVLFFLILELVLNRHNYEECVYVKKLAKQNKFFIGFNSDFIKFLKKLNNEFEKYHDSLKKVVEVFG